MINPNTNTSFLNLNFSVPSQQNEKEESNQKIINEIGKNSLGYMTLPGWTEIGTMEVQDLKTKELVKVVVESKNQFSNSRAGKIYINAVLYNDENKNGKELGRITFWHVYNHKDALYCPKWDEPLEDQAVANYGPRNKKNKLSNIYIEHIGSIGNDRYKGIGTGLMQVAIEESLNHGYEGRATLDAVGNSHGFHVKMGFFHESVIRNYSMLKKIEKMKNEDTVGSYFLHLPEKTIQQKWIPAIQNNPILKKTKSRLGQINII